MSPKSSRLKFLKLKKNGQGGNKKTEEKDHEIDLDDINEKYEKAKQLANIDPGKYTIDIRKSYKIFK